MNCNEIQKSFGIYWDLPDDDISRYQVQQHIQSCAACAEEFAIWKESAELIRQAEDTRSISLSEGRIPGMVMKRIYEAESWRIPVPERLYMISDKLRRNLIFSIAFCLGLFLISFLFSIAYGNGTLHEDPFVFGLHPVASAEADADSMDGFAMSSAVASLTDPTFLNTATAHSISQSMLAISIIGMVSTLLIMNWVSRTEQ